MIQKDGWLAQHEDDARQPRPARGHCYGVKFWFSDKKFSVDSASLKGRGRKIRPPWRGNEAVRGAIVQYGRDPLGSCVVMRDYEDGWL